MELCALPLLHELNTYWARLFPDVDTDPDQPQSPVHRFFHEQNARVLSSGAASTALPPSRPFQEAVASHFLRSPADSKIVLYGIARALARLHTMGVCYPITPDRVYIDDARRPHIQLTGNEPRANGDDITFSGDIEAYAKFAATLLGEALPELPADPPQTATNEKVTDQLAHLLLSQIRQRRSFIEILRDIQNRAFWTPETNSDQNRKRYKDYKRELDAEERKSIETSSWLIFPTDTFVPGLPLPPSELDRISRNASSGDPPSQIRAAMLALSGNFGRRKNLFYAVKLLTQQSQIPVVNFFLKCLSRGNFLHQGLLAEAKGDADAARALYRQGALEGDREAAVRYGGLLLGTRRQRVGLQLLDSFARGNPRDLLACFTLGDFYYRCQPETEDLPKLTVAANALKYFEWCTDIDSDDPEPWFYAGKLLFEQREWAKAKLKLARAVEIAQGKWRETGDTRRKSEDVDNGSERAGKGQSVLDTPDGMLVELAQRMLSDIVSIGERRKPRREGPYISPTSSRGSLTKL
jgi:tetratricopeptide (TPR) repeat protein